MVKETVIPGTNQYPLFIPRDKAVSAMPKESIKRLNLANVCFLHIYYSAELSTLSFVFILWLLCCVHSAVSMVYNLLQNRMDGFLTISD